MNKIYCIWAGAILIDTSSTMHTAGVIENLIWEVDSPFYHIAIEEGTHITEEYND